MLFEQLKCRYQIIMYVWGSKIYITTGSIKEVSMLQHGNEKE